MATGLKGWFAQSSILNWNVLPCKLYVIYLSKNKTLQFNIEGKTCQNEALSLIYTGVRSNFLNIKQGVG